MLVFRVQMFSTNRRLSFFSGLFVSDKYHTRKLRKWFGGLLHPFWNHWWSLIGSNWCDLFTNRTIVCFKSHLFRSQWGGYTKNKKTKQISKLVSNNRSNCRKNFAAFVSKTLTFSPQKMDEFSDRLSQVLHQQNIWTDQVLHLRISKWM